MTATALTPVVGFDALKGKAYRDTALGPAIVAWLAWLELGGMSPNTRYMYELTLGDLASMFPGTTLEQLDDGHLAHLLRRYPERGRVSRLSALKSFFKWAKQTRRIRDNPIDLLPVIKKPRQAFIEVFTEAECEALAGLELHDGALMRIMLETGLRKSEARNLRLRDVRLEAERPFLLVLQGKGGKDRVVPLLPSVQRAVSELSLFEGIGPDDYLWYTVGGNQYAPTRLRSEPLGVSAFHRWWRRCIARAGVTYRKPHTTRHTFATRCHKRGLLADDIQMLLGHESISTTLDLYVHERASRAGEHFLAVFE